MIIKFKNMDTIFEADTEEDIIELEWQTGQEIEYIKGVNKNDNKNLQQRK